MSAKKANLREHPDNLAAARRAGREAMENDDMDCHDAVLLGSRDK